MSEYKSLKFSVKAMDGKGTFEGYASTRKKDSYGDIVEQGAFKRTIEHSKGKVPLLWFHDPYAPIGMTEAMQEDEKGLFIKGTLDLDIETGRNVYSGIKKGYIDRMSIGYRTEKQDFEDDTRYLKEINLLEVSPVTKNFAANDTALITGAKNFTFTSELKQISSDLKDLIALFRSKDAPNSTLSSKDALQPNDAPNSTHAAAIQDALQQIKKIKETMQWN